MRTPRFVSFQPCLHQLLTLACGILAMAGFVAIYTAKNKFHQPHFVFWHGFIGALLFGYMLLHALAGAFLALRYAMQECT